MPDTEVSHVSIVTQQSKHYRNSRLLDLTLQEIHLVEAVVREYVPALHFWHTLEEVAAISVLNVPFVHFLDLARPSSSAYVPERMNIGLSYMFHNSTHDSSTYTSHFTEIGLK